MKIENKHVAILIVISVYLIFYDLIFEWIDKEIINNYLSKIRAVPRVHYTFFVLLIVITFYFVHLLKSGKHVNKWLIYTLILATINYCYYRFYNTSYTFLSTPPIPNLKYTDLLIYITAIFSLSWFVSTYFKAKEPKYNNNPFIVDTPVLKSDDDLYNRKDFAQHLAEKIQSRLPENTIGSVAMGITGKWGAGKTSFMNMIEEQLDIENRIIFKFNPWLSQSPDNIIDDFFSVMSSELKAYDKEISADLQKYSTAINNVDENIVRKTIASVHDILANGDNKQEYYNKINSSLLASKKQIIVFIDDLDRLDKKEVLVVLKLIRNTANFNNLFYVVCYDKQYVEHALTELSDYGAKTFLEKIFQYEFELPLPNYTLISEKLELTILKAFKGKILSKEIKDAVYFEGGHGTFTSKFIKTPRDIVRFVNVLENDYSIIGNNVNFTDFYLLSLVKLKFNKLYHDVTAHKELYFRKTGKYTVLITNEDSDKSETDRVIEDAANVHKPNISGDNYIIDTRINEEKDTNILQNRMLKKLFKTLTFHKSLSQISNKPIHALTRSYNNEVSTTDVRSFSYWESHENYFTLNLLETDFPVGEFLSGRLDDFESFKEKLKTWIGKGYLGSIEHRLNEIRDFDNFDEWQKHLKIIQYINCQSKYNFEIKGTVMTLMYPYTYASIINWNRENPNFVINFIKEWFNNAEYPFFYESVVISGILSDHDKYKEVFSKIELYQILNTYLSKFKIEKKEIDDDLLYFFNTITSNKEIDQYDDQIKGYIKKFEIERREMIMQRLTSDNLGIFIKKQSHKYNFDLRYIEIFNSLDELSSFLKGNMTQDEFYNEFFDFKQKYENKNKTLITYYPIDFKFNYLECKS